MNEKLIEILLEKIDKCHDESVCGQGIAICTLDSLTIFAYDFRQMMQKAGCNK